MLMKCNALKEAKHLRCYITRTITLPGHKLNTVDSKTEICKGYDAEGSRAG
jgi:hypothetical protein